MPIQYDPTLHRCTAVCDECGIQNTQEGFPFMCDTTRVALEAGWYITDRVLCPEYANKPKPEEETMPSESTETPDWAVPGEFDKWRNGRTSTPRVDPNRFGPHDYGPSPWLQGCAYGCGCCLWLGSCEPGSVHPDGMCPNNPLPKPEETAVTEELFSKHPTKTGTYLSRVLSMGDIHEVIVWRCEDMLRFAPDVSGEAQWVGQASQHRLWSREPLQVAAPKATGTKTKLVLKRPTVPGVYLSTVEGGPEHPVVVWEWGGGLRFAPDCEMSSWISEAESTRLWSRAPLPVGEPREPNCYTHDLPTEAECYGTKTCVGGKAELVIVYRAGASLCFVCLYSGEGKPQAVACDTGRLWTKRPIATLADLDGIEEEPAPDPVAEFKASVTEPFAARIMEGGGWVAVAPLQNGEGRAFAATDEERAIILCAALNKLTGQEANDAD